MNPLKDTSDMICTCIDAYKDRDLTDPECIKCYLEAINKAEIE